MTVPTAIDPHHKVVLIRIARSFRPEMSDAELYDATRRWWRVGGDRMKLGSAAAPGYALAVHQGVVRAAYRIAAWEPATRAEISEDHIRDGRWGFIGRIDRSMEDRYLHVDVTSFFPKGQVNPIRYVNC